MTATTSPLAGEDAVTEAGVVRKTAWRLMPLIMVCYMFAFFDRINISFAKFQLQSDLGFSNVAYGLGASMFVATAASQAHQSATSSSRCPRTCSSIASAPAVGSPASWSPGASPRP